MSARAIAVATLVIACCVATSPAGSGKGGFAVPWSTIDGGGAMHTIGGVFELSGTIGQPDAGGPLTGGAFSLTGGFWAGGGGGGVCAGDVDNTGRVDFADLLALLGAWGVCDGCPEDLDGDGLVTFADLLIVLGAWGPCE